MQFLELTNICFLFVSGFIGFLLLVVGLSGVLARLQEPKKPTGGVYIAPLTPYHQHAHILDRSDNVIEKNTFENSAQLSPSYAYHSNSRPYSGYSQFYYGSKLAS